MTVLEFKPNTTSEAIDRYAREIYAWDPKESKYKDSPSFLIALRVMLLREINSILTGDSVVADYTPDELTTLDFICQNSGSILDITDILKLK